MIRSNVPTATRYLRLRRGWRQADLAARAGVSRQAVSRTERGELGSITLALVGRIVEALDASVDLTMRWEGERLDRLMDAAHAALAQTVAVELSDAGWLVRSEVSFNHYGDRGRVDLLAFRPTAGTLLVVEVKSAIGDIQETLGRLDVKARLGRSIAESVGWDGVHRVVPVLVVGDMRTARRVIQRHDELFRRFSLRGRSALAWVRKPQSPAPAGLLWFAPLSDAHHVSTARRRRARTVKSGG